MKITLLFCSLIFTFVLNANLFTQWNDSIKVYWLEPVEVTSQRPSLGDYQTPVEKDNLSSLYKQKWF